MEKIKNAPLAVWHWLKDNPAAWPSIGALTAVAVFWTVGLLGGLSVLHNGRSPMMTLISLYLMLALVAFSIIVGILAATDLGRRLAQQRRGYRRPSA